MSITFTTTLLQAEDSNATGISVPAEVVAALGKGKRPKVVVTVNGRFSYRSTVAPYAGGVNMLPVSAERRAAAGIKAGDQIEVTLELDTEPRTVDVPDDLAAALAAKPGAREAFDQLSYTMRNEHVRQVETAKAAETRQRRIAGIVAKLANA
jgi:hypothetical protein